MPIPTVSRRARRWGYGSVVSRCRAHKSTIRSYLIELFLLYRLLPDGFLAVVCRVASANDRMVYVEGGKVYGNLLCALKVVDTGEERSCWWR